MTTAPSDDLLRDILGSTRVIAAVGLSPKAIRPSHFVGRYLALRGYRVIPINPGQVGKDFYGEPFRASLADCADEGVDMVEIFRRSESVPPIVEEALAHLPDLRTVWMQVGVENAEAAAQAEAAGCRVVQNRCPKIEHQRLYGELRKAGFNTGIISSRL